MSHRDYVRDFPLDQQRGRHLEEIFPYMRFTQIFHPNKEMDGDDEYWSEYEWNDEDEAEDEDEDEEGDDPTGSNWSI